MRIYTYGQQTVRAGRVYRGDDPEHNGDLDLWGEGTEGELIQQAQREMAIYHPEQDANQYFGWKRARNVVAYLAEDDDAGEPEEVEETR